MAASARPLLPPPVTLLLAVCLLAAAPVEAQRAAYRLDGSTPRTAVIDLGTGQSRDVSPDEAQIGAVFTSDGRFAVRAVSGTTVVRDMGTGQVTTFPVDFRPVLAHPRRPMLFGFDSSLLLARLDARGLAQWTPCDTPAPLAKFDVSVDGTELVVACPNGTLAVLDTESGQVTRTVPTPFTGLRLVAVRDGGDVVVAGTTGGGTSVARLDGRTGQVRRSRVGLPNWTRTGSRLQVMEDNCSVTSCAYQLVDTDTLDVSRVLPGATPFLGRVFVAPDGREAVFNDAGFAYAASRATWLEVATGRVLGEVVMPAGDTITVDVQPRPLPPVALAAAAPQPQTVTLSWTQPGPSPQVTGYRLEAGAAPGATAVTIELGSVLSTTIPGVPPGRYYARVRAVNYNGVSLASNEVVIDVP